MESNGGTNLMDFVKGVAVGCGATLALVAAYKHLHPCPHPHSTPSRSSSTSSTSLVASKDMQKKADSNSRREELKKRSGWNYGLGSAYLMSFAQMARDVKGNAAYGSSELISLAMSDGPADTWKKLTPELDLELTSCSKPGAGALECRQAVADFHRVSIDQVMLIGGGTSIVNHHAINSVLFRGGIVLAEWPIYDPLEADCRMSFADNASEIGFNPEYRIERLPENNFQIDLTQWREKIQKHNPRLIILTNPHNPSCVQIKNLRQLLSFVDEHNKGLDEERQTYVLVDEVYREVHVNDIPAAVNLSPYAISTFSLTKTLGLSGLRFGIILGPKEVIEQVLAYYSASQAANSPLLESLWLQVYQKKDALLKDAMAVQKARLDMIREMFDGASIPYFPPDGGSAMLVKIPSTVTTVEFVTRLKQEHDVMVTNGEFFSLPGYVRIAYMRLTDELLKTALERFITFYKSI